MNRQQRRALDRRADRAFARIRGELVAADFTRDLIVVREHGRPDVVRGERIDPLLSQLGVRDMRETIESFRGKPGWVPALVVVDTYATVRRIEAPILSRGGVA